MPAPLTTIETSSGPPDLDLDLDLDPALLVADFVSRTLSSHASDVGDPGDAGGGGDRWDDVTEGRADLADRSALYQTYT